MLMEQLGTPILMEQLGTLMTMELLGTPTHMDQDTPTRTDQGCNSINIFKLELVVI